MSSVLRSLCPALGRDDCSRELAGSFDIGNVKGGDSPHKAILIITGGWGTVPEQVLGKDPTRQNDLKSSISPGRVCDGGCILYPLTAVSS
ncbi:hypothetical protein ACRRTK_007998 [Alexandromys fortis]